VRALPLIVLVLAAAPRARAQEEVRVVRCPDREGRRLEGLRVAVRKEEPPLPPGDRAHPAARLIPRTCAAAAQVAEMLALRRWWPGSGDAPRPVQAYFDGDDRASYAEAFRAAARRRVEREDAYGPDCRVEESSAYPKAERAGRFDVLCPLDRKRAIAVDWTSNGRAADAAKKGLVARRDVPYVLEVLYEAPGAADAAPPAGARPKSAGRAAPAGVRVAGVKRDGWKCVVRVRWKPLSDGASARVYSGAPLDDMRLLDADLPPDGKTEIDVDGGLQGLTACGKRVAVRVCARYADGQEACADDVEAPAGP